jgi:hypothetical protein
MSARWGRMWDVVGLRHMNMSMVPHVRPLLANVGYSSQSYSPHRGFRRSRKLRTPSAKSALMRIDAFASIPL